MGVIYRELEVEGAARTQEVRAARFKLAKKIIRNSPNF